MNTNSLIFSKLSLKNTAPELPFFGQMIAAGFPSPADEFLENSLDLNTLLIKHPASTFMARVSGDSMRDVGVFSDDIVIVDRAITPKNNHIVIAVLDGAMVVKRLNITKKGLRLLSENENYDPIVIKNPEDLIVWGVVTSVIHRFVE